MIDCESEKGMPVAADVAAVADAEVAVAVVAAVAAGSTAAIKKATPATLGGGIGSICATVDC